MLCLPDRGVWLGDVELTEPYQLVGGDVNLDIVARGEGDLLIGADRFKNEFLDEGCHAEIADDPEVVGFLVTRTCAACIDDIEVKTPLAFLERVSGESPTDGSPGG